MDLGLAGKCAIVTGGSRGIGKAVARSLLREGAKVTLVARTKDALEAAAKELARETGGQVFFAAADTGDDASVKAAVADAVAKMGGVDIVVNCAAQPGGQLPPPKVGEINNDNFWADMNVKVLGYLRVIRESTPSMLARGGGRIVNVSGLAARSTGTAIGSMRNVAVAALTKNIADELGAKGITAVTLHPGTVRTEKTPAVIAERAKRQNMSEADVEKQMGAANALGRIVDSSELGDIICFLASPRATIINGDPIAAGAGARGAIHY